MGNVISDIVLKSQKSELQATVGDSNVESTNTRLQFEIVMKEIKTDTDKETNREGERKKREPERERQNGKCRKKESEMRTDTER